MANHMKNENEKCERGNGLLFLKNPDALIYRIFHLFQVNSYMVILIFICKVDKKSTLEIRRIAAGGVSHTVTGHRAAAEISRAILIL